MRQYPASSSAGLVRSKMARRTVCLGGAFTLTLLWSEYCVKVRNDGYVTCMYTQFCGKYRRRAHVTKAAMRIARKPGDAMQVDCKTLTVAQNAAVYHIQPNFIEVTPTDTTHTCSSLIHVKCGNFNVSIEAGTDPATIQDVIWSLQKTC